MRKFIIISGLLLLTATITIAWFSHTGVLQRTLAINGPKITTAYVRSPVTDEKLKGKAMEAKEFVKNAGYNQQVCFFIDMSLPSGQNRFFVYHFGKDSVINTGVVTHGRCNEQWLEGRKYGNTVGCGCTSLGKYKIGYSYQGRFGLAYKLYGLDKTNDKAFERFVVLHSHECVPESEVKDEICQSDGCPTVSPGFLKYLKPLLDKSGKPVLLWIYE